MQMTDEEKTLKFNPFEGDFGDQRDRVLKNKMGVARKSGECDNCAQQIQPGERIRLMAAIFDGDLMSYRWCALCCAAMATCEDDNGKAYEARFALRGTQSP